MNTHKSTVFSLYRSSRRQINLLPSEYLRQFYRLKLSEDVRKLLAVKREDLQKPKLKRLKTKLVQLESANNGSYMAFNRLLETAYGQRGILKWEILKPLLSQNSCPPADRIIPAVEKSRPPVYSPLVATLVTSPYSRQRPLQKKQLQSPNPLPARVDPNHEEAQLLGPLSKRREVNIRWRFFTDQTKRINPPLQVVAHDKTTGLKETSLDAVNRAGIQPIGFQGTGIYEEAIALAGPKPRRPPIPKRERYVQKSLDQLETKTPATELPNRFLRRRFQLLISKIPVLTYTYTSDGSSSRPGSYSVSSGSNVIPGSVELRKSSSFYANADPSLLEWVSQEEPKQK